MCVHMCVRECVCMCMCVRLCVFVSNSQVNIVLFRGFRDNADRDQSAKSGESPFYVVERHETYTDYMYRITTELKRVHLCTEGDLHTAKAKHINETGVAWRGVAWRGVAWRGVAWRGVAWRGVAWRGVAWRGVAWRGVAWRGVAWRGVAKCVMSCQ